MSFIVDNKLVFDICPEFMISYFKFIESWNKNRNENTSKMQNLYGQPSFAKIEHIFITHLHYDHWGGLRHFLIWSQMFESSFRESKPFHIYIPKKNLDLFQARFKELFNIPEEQKFSSENFFLRYLIVEIDSSLVKNIKIHALEGDQTIQIGKYQIKTFENTHFMGSLSYKLVSTKYKLNEEKLDLYGLAKGPLLSKIQRESQIEVDGKIIMVHDIFTIEKTILGYSGDTQVDKNLVIWLKDCTHLIHETTYFEEQEIYHTESHSTLQELLPLLTGPELKIFLPVHFSERYSWPEIQTMIEKIKELEQKYQIYAPKLGSIIYYDDKKKNIQIEELQLEQSF
jgi:ribonuclease Z